MRFARPAALLIFACASVAYGQNTAPAPQYRMATYVVGLLRKGPNWTPGETGETRRIQEGHMENIRRMARAGILIIAGPFSDDGDLRGMFIFRAKSPGDVREMVNADPAVKAGRLVVDLHPWYAGEGLVVQQPAK